MLRLIVMALRSFFFLIYEINKCNYMMKRPEKYSELDKYREVQKIVDKMRKNSRTTTKVYGKENLPETGNYVMYANHQGHYDGLGIVCNHDRPLTIIIDSKREHQMIVRQMLPMVGGHGINLKDARQQMKTMMTVTRELKEGKIYLLFLRVSMVTIRIPFRILKQVYLSARWMPKFRLYRWHLLIPIKQWMATASGK